MTATNATTKRIEMIKSEDNERDDAMTSAQLDKKKSKNDVQWKIFFNFSSKTMTVML